MESRNRSHSHLHMLHHNAVLCQNMPLHQLLICFMELGHSVRLLRSSHRSVLPVCCVVYFLLSLNATYFKHASTSCSLTKTKQMIIVITHSQPVPSPSDVHPDCTAGSCLKTNITGSTWERSPSSSRVPLPSVSVFYCVHLVVVCAKF